YCIAVKEQGDTIVFLRKIVRGGADKSYGIQVARLAGVPEDILDRASQIVDLLSSLDSGEQTRMSLSRLHEKAEELADKEVRKESRKKKSNEFENQFSLFSTPSSEDVIDEIRNMDISNLTPLDCLNKLYTLQKRIRSEL
ncbi:MAG: DNA mismatch repair protein MutS, partial [Lachnospiraceae bacterium]|nr:DNA mismatch repair protein MutS [Lachnospiraceae bacterium]